MALEWGIRAQWVRHLYRPALPLSGSILIKQQGGLVSSQCGSATKEAQLADTWQALLLLDCKLELHDAASNDNMYQRCKVSLSISSYELSTVLNSHWPMHKHILCIAFHPCMLNKALSLSGNRTRTIWLTVYVNTSMLQISSILNASPLHRSSWHSPMRATLTCRCRAEEWQEDWSQPGGGWCGCQAQHWNVQGPARPPGGQAWWSEG